MLRKTYRNGTHRLVAPEETLARVAPWLEPMGITRLANITHLDHLGIPVFQAIRPNSKSLSVHQGKGQTIAAAKVSAAMEAAESWHAQNIELPRRVASCDAMAESGRIAAPEWLPVGVETEIDRNAPLTWIGGRDLLADTPAWVPLHLVSTDYTRDPELPALARSSNGLASGNHVVEAVVAALCELIERDAIALWRSADPAATAGRRVDPETVDDEACRVLLRRIDDADLQLSILDLTSDIGVPVFASRLIDCASDGPVAFGPAWGFGCHPARAVALSRALTEAAQSRLTQIAGARDDIDPASYGQGLDLTIAALLEELQWSRVGGKAYSEVAQFLTDDLETELTWLLDRLAQAGLGQAICVDLTHPRVGLPVVRMLVPGLGRRAVDGKFSVGRRPKSPGSGDGLHA